MNAMLAGLLAGVSAASDVVGNSTAMTAHRKKGARA
jgi:hypothetical protein